MEYTECKYTPEDIDKIMGFSSWNNKKKMDTLFHIDCVMYSNLGLDSTATERKQVKSKSRTIYRAIKQLDPSLGKMLLGSMD